jgi:PAS domain S-box-containing protein
MFTLIQDSLVRRPINIESDPIFFELAMRSNPNLIFVKDQQSRFVYANRALMELFAPERRNKIIGYTTVEDSPSPQAEIFLEEDRRTFREGKSEIVEEVTDYKMCRKTFMVQKMTFRAANGMLLLLGFGTDITDLARRERDLVQSNAMLENFAALAAHDLRTPLSSFSGYLSLILYDKNNVLTPAATKYMAMMQDSLMSLSDQISGILSTYKASNSHKVDFCSIDLNILFEEAKFNMGNIIASNKASILSSRLPTLAVDPNLFRHLVMNFVENSIKYRSRKDPVIILRYARKNGEHIFSVEDNGIGIKPEEEKNLFQMYEQGGKSCSGGVGIGLALCRSIIEMHGGRVWIDHEYAQGCRICFTIQPSALNADVDRLH